LVLILGLDAAGQFFGPRKKAEVFILFGQAEIFLTLNYSKVLRIGNFFNSDCKSGLFNKH
jgi:hypothetical protein